MASRSTRLSPLLRRPAAAARPSCPPPAPVHHGLWPRHARVAARTMATSPGLAAPQAVRLTADTYPSLRRDERFARVTDEHVADFRRMLGSDDDGAVLYAAGGDGDGVRGGATEADLEAYNVDWMRKYAGQTRLVLRPRSTEQVSRVLRYCGERMLAVVPQGGNTGLVGGSVPVFDEVVVSMGRMSRVESFDPVSGTVVVEAGAVLEVVDSYLAERGHVFPLDLGAKGSCQVGGNVATNAGGLRLLRYGSLHGSVLGMEAVLPDGTVLDDLCTLRKNNTGYDLKQLLVGAEGTLGVITRLAVACPQRPAAVNVAYLGVDSFEAARRAFAEAKAHLSEILSAFELMDAQSQRMVRRVRGADRMPLQEERPFYCLVETSGSNGEHDYAKLEAFLEDAMAKDVVADGVVAQDATQARELWGWREGIPECLGHWGGVYKYDVSIPLADMYGLVEATRQRLREAGLLGEGEGEGDSKDSPVVGAVGYGHMGDSNLHLNVATTRYDAEIESALEPFVYEWIASRKGSISAEHGLGIAKKKHIGYSRSETMIRLMRQIKDLYDPKGIMNPYKYI